MLKNGGSYNTSFVDLLQKSYNFFAPPIIIVSVKLVIRDP